MIITLQIKANNFSFFFIEGGQLTSIFNPLISFFLRHSFRSFIFSDWR